MSKINIKNLILDRQIASPKNTFGNKRACLTEKLFDLNEEKGRAPFDIEIVSVDPGKKDWPYHVHATGWELYIAVEGKAQMRLDDSFVEMAEGDSIQCAPGVAHQIINRSKEIFRYWLVSDSPSFDTYYYPDSDKLTARGVLGASSREMTWTKFREGCVENYWEGEE